MFYFDPLYAVVLVVLSAIIPGVLIGFPLLRNTNLSRLEKVVISFIAGLFIPPFLSFIENGFLNIPFSQTMVYLNILLTTVIGIVIFWKFGYIERIPKLWKEEVAAKLKEPKFNWITAIKSVVLSPAFIILVLMFLAWFLRFQAWTPIYQELDPYYYTYGTHQLLTLGNKPLVDDSAWYPQVTVSHRGMPLYHFMIGHWYYLYTPNYDKYILTAVSSMYPSIVAALLVFMAYLFIKTIYDERYGLFAAGLMALLPATLLKMAAGVFELQPLSIFVAFFFFAMFALAIKFGRKEYYLLCGGALAVMILGGTVTILLLIE